MKNDHKKCVAINCEHMILAFPGSIPGLHTFIMRHPFCQLNKKWSYEIKKCDKRATT